MALNDFKDANQGGGVLTVSNSNIGKGIEWNPDTKQYEVNIGEVNIGNGLAGSGLTANNGQLSVATVRLMDASGTVHLGNLVDVTK